ncbi:MAG TPA: molecular chaperone HtpG [Stellaceae bacterium]|jgi:molecular chaperone HtpG|nr:molecular chaperone HtpG [Stellaceae bacterium]
MSAEKRSFQAEVSRLLDIVAHSLYSEKEIFLRELISNASDACDRLRYAALTQPELAGEDTNFRVVLTPDKSARTLTVDDNGIGMNHDELIENLGTIARSGTAAFMEKLASDKDGKEKGKDVSLIGQFGVGFYSAFMVADEVEVIARKAGDSASWRWRSDGKGEFTVEPAEKAARGTTIILHLRKGEDEFLEPHRLRHIVKTYSDHIALPIVLKDGDPKDGGGEATLNAASALWTRSKSEITPEQYKEFYHHVAHSFDEPWLTIHARAEGKIEYTNLLFVPSSKPFDLFDPQRKNHVKLYVRRVFITDDCQNLLPPYLRFLRGIVDSEDLPLNVSREMLQNNPILSRIKGQLTKRVISELAKKASDAPEEYAKFWDNFGAVLKEGLYEDREQQEALLPLIRFRSTAGDALVSFEDYVGRMKPGQDTIYYLTGDKLELLKKSPQLEGFRARGVEVLLLTDPVDEFWMPALGKYKVPSKDGAKDGAKDVEHALKSITRGGADLSKIAAQDGEAKAADKADDTKAAGNIGALIAIFKLALGDAVKDVRISDRLTDSAVCLVADEGDMDMHLERLLKQHRQLDAEAKRILEINPKSALVERLALRVGQEGASDQLGEFAWLLLDQARILEGEPLPDPSAFARRLSTLLEKGLAVAA